MSKLQIINQKAAGIDIGSEKFFVSVDGQQVESFDTFTSSISLLIAYLSAHKIQTVAIEATGVLWLPLYDALEKSGFEVYLVNGAHARNIPAQKSDPADCRWLQRLHSYGLFRASFVPKGGIRQLRTYMRFREDCLEISASHILHMQRAMELMNIKLKNVISQIHGTSGLKIIEAILAGERNPEELLKLCHGSIRRKKREQVLQSLEGNFQSEYLFLLQKAYDGWLFYQMQIEECESKIEEVLKELTQDLPQPESTLASPSRHHLVNIPGMHEMMVQLTGGKNATVLPGISDTTVLKLISELGSDLTRWPTEKHFTSYLGLSPKKCDSGKRKRSKRNGAKTKAGQIFRECAMSISNSKYLALKGFYHRLKSRSGPRVAMKATARKLAVLYYRFMTKGMDYVENGLKNYEDRYKLIMLKSIKKKAKDLGVSIVIENQALADIVH